MTDPGDEELEDDPVEYEDDPFNEFGDEEAKVEPLSFPDAYAAAANKPVELEVPVHSDAFSVLKKAKESRFPAKSVSKSAKSLASALKSAATKH